MLNVSKSIAVALLFLVALTLSLGHPAAAEESVAFVLFSQPPDPAGGSPRRATMWRTPWSQ